MWPCNSPSECTHERAYIRANAHSDMCVSMTVVSVLHSPTLPHPTSPLHCRLPLLLQPYLHSVHNSPVKCQAVYSDVRTDIWQLIDKAGSLQNSVTHPARVKVSTHTHTHAHTDTHARTCMHTHARTCTHNTRTHMHAHIRTPNTCPHTHAHMHTHTHTHTRAHTHELTHCTVVPCSSAEVAH